MNSSHSRMPNFSTINWPSFTQLNGDDFMRRVNDSPRWTHFESYKFLVSNVISTRNAQLYTCMYIYARRVRLKAKKFFITAQSFFSAQRKLLIFLPSSSHFSGTPRQVAFIRWIFSLLQAWPRCTSLDLNYIFQVKSSETSDEAILHCDPGKLNSLLVELSEYRSGIP